MRFRFIAAEKAQYPIALLCRCLRVSRSVFYAWASRGLSNRARDDVRLIAQLRLAHADSRQTYGRPRLCRALRDRGVAVSGKRVARLMRVAGLRARGRRRFVMTTDSRHNFMIAPNRVRRQFQPRRLNRVWAPGIHPPLDCPKRPLLEDQRTPHFDAAAAGSKSVSLLTVTA
jgi:putative transposase